MDAKNLYQQERDTLKFSLFTVICLMLWGLVFNELTDSNIVELDAGAYIISGIVGLITIYVSRMQELPGSIGHPLGYSGYIPILNLIRSLMVILICMKAIAESLGSLFNTPPPSDHGIVFLYSGVTFLFNSFSYFYVHKKSTKLNSALLKTDAVEWKIDTLYNITILAAFALAYILHQQGYTSISTYVDPVMCMVLSFYMCITPARMFSENVKILSISSTNSSLKNKIISQLTQEVPELLKHQINYTLLNVSGILWLDIEIQTSKGELEPSEMLVKASQYSEELMKEISPNTKVTYRFALS